MYDILLAIDRRKVAGAAADITILVGQKVVSVARAFDSAAEMKVSAAKMSGSVAETLLSAIEITVSVHKTAAQTAADFL